MENLRFVVGDYESLGFTSEFDCAIFYDSLHHAEDERRAMASVYGALKPGGVCVTLEPGEGHADQPTSLEVAEKYGVVERDMPPNLIIAAGGAAGFREFQVFPRPIDLAPAAPYTPPPPPPPPPGLNERIREVFFPPHVGTPPAPHPIDYFRISALVRMRK